MPHWTEQDFRDELVALQNGSCDYTVAELLHEMRASAALAAAERKIATLEQQLDRHWVCPCCRQGCTDPDCCTAAATNGVAVIAAAERQGREEALYTIRAHIENNQRAPYAIGWDVACQALREVEQDIKNGTLFGHDGYKPTNPDAGTGDDQC